MCTCVCVRERERERERGSERERERERKREREKEKQSDCVFNFVCVYANVHNIIRSMLCLLHPNISVVSLPQD